MPSALYIRDKDGNFVPIYAIKGAPGEDGKSAYELACEGGYAGTKEEFIAMLNGLTSSEDATHYADFNNPHRVTAMQTGAIPQEYYVSADLNTELQQGGNKVTICCYNGTTLNTPKTEGKTDYAHGMVITNAYTNQYGTQICLPSGDNNMYVRRCNKSGITAWRTVENAEEVARVEEIATRAFSTANLADMDLRSLINNVTPLLSTKKVVASSYVGTGTYQDSGATSIPLKTAPIFGIIKSRKYRDIGIFGGLDCVPTNDANSEIALFGIHSATMNSVKYSECGVVYENQVFKITCSETSNWSADEFKRRQFNVAGERYDYVFFCE